MAPRNPHMLIFRTSSVVEPCPYGSAGVCGTYGNLKCRKKNTVCMFVNPNIPNDAGLCCKIPKKGKHEFQSSVKLKCFRTNFSPAICAVKSGTKVNMRFKHQ